MVCMEPTHPHRDDIRVAAARQHGFACLNASYTHFFSALVPTVAVVMYLCCNVIEGMPGHAMAQTRWVYCS